MTTTDVFEFEGEEITDFAVQIPSTKLETGKAYPRGTILNMNVSLRVRSVRIDEDRQGNMIRTHLLAVEDAAVKKAVTPAERRATMEAEEAAEQAAKEKVIDEEPGVEDGVSATEPLQNEVTEDVAEDTDFSDVEARDAEQVQAAQNTETDADQYADAETF